MNKVNWDEFAQLGSLRSVLDQKDQSNFKNRLIDAIQWEGLKRYLNPGTKLLDFGCGTGRFSSRISAMKIDYIGIDSSVGMIEKAHGLNPLNIYINFDGLSIPCKDNEFDTVLFCGVFQYIIGQDECEKIVREIVRVLKPGAIILLLEQASLSQSMSGTVNRSSTELDYINVLSEHFKVESIDRIRSCEMPQLSYFSFRIAKRLPYIFPWFLNRLASNEVKMYKKMNEQYYKTIKYYDFLLKAVVRE